MAKLRSTVIDDDSPRTAGRKAAKSSTGKARDPLRYVVKGTVQELARNAGALFPSVSVHTIDQEAARIAFRANDVAGDFLAHPDNTNLYCFILNRHDLPVSGVRLEFTGGWTERDARVASVLAHVFNGDLDAAPLRGRHSDLWTSLQQTRFIRIIARLTTFNTNVFLRSLRTIEGARELTYEGSAYATQILLTKAMKNVAERAGKRFVYLPTPMPLGTAILGEKWPRALTMSGSVALVVLAHRQVVHGLLILPQDTSSAPAGLDASFEAIGEALVDGVALIVATAHGDIWVRLSNGMTFLRRRSRWQFIDLEPVKALLTEHTTPSVADALLRLALDASFERRGALLSVVDDPSNACELVRDHDQKKGRANRSLRDMLRGLDILEPIHATLLRSALAVDGAILLAPDGKILDAGCLVVDPPEHRIEALPIARWRAYPGARSTAARNCSAYGIALKISEDGPISVFEHGRLRLELG